MTWIDTHIEDFWKIKCDRIQILVNGACENFLRRQPEVIRFTADTAEFLAVKPRVLAHAEDYAAHQAQLGRISRPMMDALKIALEKNVTAHFDEMISEAQMEMSGAAR